MSYLVLKHIHVTAVALSGGLFFLRGLWMLADSPQLRRPWVRILPHVIDTVLLVSAVALALLIRQYPFVDGWLTAKTVALVGYILLGTVAIKRGRSKPLRLVAWLVALAVFGYIVLVARSHDPMPPILTQIKVSFARPCFNDKTILTGTASCQGRRFHDHRWRTAS